MEKDTLILNEVDLLVTSALEALDEYMEFTQEKIDEIVAKVSVEAIDAHGRLAKLAVEETKRGVFEDKATKNLFSVEYVINHMRHLKTVGIISENTVTGITEVADPVGVICAITPVTNPTSTTIFKSLIALKTRNPIVFAFHPNAQNSSKEAARIIKEAAIKSGAPKNCISWIEHPSLDNTNKLMNHPGIATILATGGNAMVKAAYSCGKPALGVGAGNVPAYIEKTANIKTAINEIVMSKSFDNGMVCASEQAAIIDKEIYKEALAEFKKLHTFLCNKEQKQMLETFMFPDGVKLNPYVVGKSAHHIAELAGFEVPLNTNILLVECKSVGKEEPLTREKLSPVLAILKSNDEVHGVALAKSMVELDGLGHSAVIHTQNDELKKTFGLALKAIRIIVNSPATFGGIGNVYNRFIPSLTLGCGSYGKNSVSDNVSAIHLLNIKRIGERKNNMQWFKVPSKIYFEKDSIEYLRQMRDVNKVVIITDRVMVDLGYVKKVTDQLSLRRNHVVYQLFTDVEADPSIETVHKGYELMKSFQPDTIIAIGGGSPMDAAKAMWLFYENPEVDFNDLKQKFMDIRKRAFRYPDLGRKSKLVCIPTTSGTGSEVTPFAVITDNKESKKYPLADYSLTPTVAIIDPALTLTQPKSVTADTGMDVLTHAVEAYVSVLANDYTDSLAIQAVKMVFKYLKRAFDNGLDFEAREKMHNASTMAGMAFGNAFLGISHSMAHKVGGRYHIPHGRINAILLPHVVLYNGTVPAKLSTWPKYTYYVADEKYMELARAIGLDPKSKEEGVKMFAKACHDLAVSLGINMSFASQKVEEKDFLEHSETLAYLAYEDQCSTANPRLPLVADMKVILENAYYGKLDI
ncbi:bifunctional acetaldehyde-CoA/alcohol dehydrogenase [Acholeplasma laidlawii]|uniref:Aldehyde-alcohol dehydrogenase n=1 Tax=Acholeplasma laidlawii TaxID=2148 RepID=A0A553IJH3_ACHLA|nr:bifunctional acetaldehyde-CoA/alcohol dehydrogenase [Acholeplasma laidlawii]NWH10636.1 bifunctional acetaldehyde-CoA/alcohol dehydrogenase [Acholeplasma laidlawii]NWH12021.1 bifunctional acetaldehyde-CoA/alcohol dehydrogenase [Acholeplasma laidlawii]NWH12570.1 bifunctional acetaldehyde-CoA/alcohol dehydrogenase [Acholeplasma laidlawii]NWH14796.1 bifunctional acetaldehyde-CoA/alcohol dehydrogenase [Acholeplasma laidlawii]OAN18862.1 bifunctional acetaldehyde-CoA/alcohol dehydrogenase [Acholep